VGANSVHPTGQTQMEGSLKEQGSAMSECGLHQTCCEERSAGGLGVVPRLRGAIAVIVIVLGLVTTYFYHRLESWEQRLRREAAVERYSSEFVRAISAELNSLADIARNACLLYAASDKVEPNEWATFERMHDLARRPGLESIEYRVGPILPGLKEGSLFDHASWSPGIDLVEALDSTPPDRRWGLRMWMPVYSKAAVLRASHGRGGEEGETNSDRREGTDPRDSDWVRGLAACRPSGFIVMRIDPGPLLDRVRFSSLPGRELALYWRRPDQPEGRLLARSANVTLASYQSQGNAGVDAVHGTSPVQAERERAAAEAGQVNLRPVPWKLSPLWLKIIFPADWGVDAGWGRRAFTWIWGGLAALAAAGIVLGMARLPSALKHAQRVVAAALAESRRQYRVLFDSALEGLIVLDEDFRIREINLAGARLLCRDARQIIGRRLDELVSLKDDTLRQQVDRVIRWQVPECGEWHWTVADLPCEIEGALAAVRIRGKWWCLAAFHNVTQQNAARRELEATSRSLREVNARLRAYSEAVEQTSHQRIALVASMWHELRAPLSLIVSYARQLWEDETEAGGNTGGSSAGNTVAAVAAGVQGREPCPEETADASRREAIEAILHNAEHLLPLVNDILDFSKLEAGQVRLDIQPVSLREVVDHVVAMYRIRAQGKGIRLEWEVAPSVPQRILTDPLRLRQVLGNLTDNAIKFTEAGCVRIEAEFVQGQGDPKVYLRVRDTGIGMSEDQLGRLFQPFAQAAADTSRKFGGTGLGLMICRRLAHLLEGDIWAESKPGRGTVFHVQVSARIAPAGAAASDAGSHAAPLGARQEGLADGGDHLSRLSERKESLRILLAEDSVENQRLIRRLLERGGATVTTVENGAQAVHAVLHDHQPGAPPAPEFDLVLMDVEMPEMDGPTAVRTLRQSGCGIPILALTAHSDPDLMRGFLEAGYSACLVKPITSAELWQEIHRRLSQPVRCPAQV